MLMLGCFEKAENVVKLKSETPEEQAYGVVEAQRLQRVPDLPGQSPDDIWTFLRSQQLADLCTLDCTVRVLINNPPLKCLS